MLVYWLLFLAPVCFLLGKVERQRIGIARALYEQADTIFFDEATSALDNETEQAVMQIAHNIGEQTVSLIGHVFDQSAAALGSWLNPPKSNTLTGVLPIAQKNGDHGKL